MVGRNSLSDGWSCSPALSTRRCQFNAKPELGEKKVFGVSLMRFSYAVSQSKACSGVSVGPWMVDKTEVKMADSSAMFTWSMVRATNVRKTRVTRRHAHCSLIRRLYICRTEMQAGKLFPGYTRGLCCAIAGIHYYLSIQASQSRPRLLYDKPDRPHR